MSKLHISDSLSLPIDSVTQTFGILAKRRAGKSYTARRFAEQLSRANQQIAIVDPKGDWWGIRSAADGKSPGLSIVILGGERGDVPLEVGSGEVVAKLVAEERVSVLLDLSLFRKHEVATFMTAFLENLYRIKAKEKFRTPLMLFLDEADAIAPQHPQKNEARMLGAAEDIVRRGGQRGIGCTLITQRSAVLNKNVLTQAEVLVTLRTIAPQDLKAIEAWIDLHGTEKQGETLMQSLPALPIGDAWFWSPGWPTSKGIFQRVHVLPIETFDSGATPKPGQKRIEPKNAADVDLEALRKTMSQTIERAKAEDPKELRKQLRVATQQLEDLKRAVANRPTGKTEIKKVPVLKDVQVERLEKIPGQLDVIFKGQRESIEKLFAKFEAVAAPMAAPIKDGIAKTRQPSAMDLAHGRRGPVQPISRSQTALPARHAPVQRAFTSANGNGESASLGVGERRCAIAIAQHPNGVAREQLTTLTGYKRSTRNTYLQRMLSAGYIAQSGERFTITDAGVDWIGSDYQPLPTGEALQRYWIDKLPAGESAVFRAVLENQSNGISRDEIGEHTNFKRSTRNTYLQRLAARELVTISGDLVRPSETLFE